ncbi:FG-GAP repeat domain-containing protein [Nannocystaceae bacterium ST9]
MTKPISISLAVLTCSLIASPAWAGFGLDANALDPQACNGQGCWTNHMRLTDIDGDGDLDIVLANYADFFGGGDDPEPLVIYTNDGAGNFTNVSDTALGGHVGNHHQIAIGDVDGDGSRDIYGPDGSGGAHVLFINDGSGNFVDEADARLPGEYPQGGAARMGDVDGDGDLDIFVSADYSTNGPPYGYLYVNDGTGVFTTAQNAIPDSFSGSDIDDVEFFDADRDFDLDLLINPHNGAPALWLNDGSGNFAEGGSFAPPGPGSQFHYNAAPCDVDGDGDLDMWIDNTGGNYTEQLLINDGNANFTDETNARVTGNPGQDDNGVACVDIDDDGDLDGVVLSLGTPERLLENDGAGNFAYVPGVFPGPTDCTLWGEFGDLDGDGRIDLVTSQGECSSSDEVYLADDAEPTDSHAPVLIAVEEVPLDIEPVVRFAVGDSTVTDEGPRLAKAYALVDPAGAATEVAADFMGGDLFRVVLPAVDVETDVQFCAEDLAGNNACSETQTYGGGGSPDTGESDTTGDTGDTAGDTTSDTAGDTAGDTVGDDEVGTEDTAGDTAGADEDGSGCACTQSPDSRGFGWAVLAMLGLGMLRRRPRA